MLLLSQDTPMIYMGEEFINTQDGNNNPYCQDSAITWLNWGQLSKNEEIFKMQDMRFDQFQALIYYYEKKMAKIDPEFEGFKLTAKNRHKI